ncbi:MAG: hypothetical protein D6741_14505, partial [Planctomycetota bacterium]
MFRSGMTGIGVLLVSAGLVWGQYGLTGAPELMSFPQNYPAAQPPQNVNNMPASYGYASGNMPQAAPYSQPPAAAFNQVPGPQYRPQVAPQAAYYPAVPPSQPAMPYAVPQQSPSPTQFGGRLIPTAATAPAPATEGEEPLLLEA